MTVTGDPVTPATYRVTFGAAPGASPRASWRSSARLAWREVRRRPGRTALVVVLVMLPTMAMALGVIVARTEARWSADTFTREAGRVADINTAGSVPIESTAMTGSPVTSDDEGLAALLPAGSDWVRYTSAWGMVRAAGDEGRATWAQVTDLPIDDPVTGGLVEVRKGASPGPGEVVVTGRLADWFGVGVGDTLELERPAGSWRVSGLAVTLQGRNDDRLIFSSFDWAQVRSDYQLTTLLVDLPGEPDWATVEPVLRDLGGGAARALDPFAPQLPGEVKPAALAWGWVAGVLGLVVVGIVISAAFATSARRQLVTLGQLAAQGAPRPVVRRMLALQGWWTGLLGATTGAGVGVVLAVAGRPLLERMWSHPIGGVVVRPSDLAVIVLTGAVAGTVAALVPARSASRVPVLAALSGRRPVGKVPAFLVPVGVVLFSGGLGLIALALAASRPPNGDAAGANPSLVALVVILGGLGILFGACCASPLVVDGATRVVARLGGVPRLAARSLARARGRSAAVVTTVAVVGAVAVLVSTVLATAVARRPALGWDEADPYPPNVVIVNTAHRGGEGPVRAGDVPPELRVELERIVPGGSFLPLRIALPPTAVAQDRPSGPGLVGADPGPGALPMNEMWWMAALVADDHVVEMVGLAEGDRGRLDEVGAMALQAGRWLMSDIDGTGPRPETVEMDVAVGTTLTAAVPQEAYASHLGWQDLLVTEAAAARLGLVVVPVGEFVVAPAALTDAQRTQLNDLQSLTQDSVFLPADGQPDLEAAPWRDQVSISWMWDEGIDLPVEAGYAVIVGLALLFTLLVVAIGLSLSATESRDERDVLVAVGARPRALRRMAGVKAVVLSGTGVVMAVPVGLLPAGVVLRDGGGTVAVPWLAIGLLVAVVPVVAGLLSWAASGVAQRFRPVHASSFARD